MSAVELRWGAATDVGMVRAANQDSYLLAGTTFAVADGMGGHVAGEVAAQEALSAFRDSLGAITEDGLRSAVSRANSAVYDRSLAQAELRGMGTTLVALATSPHDQRGVLVNVGDSRAYRLRNSKFVRLSRDHTFVEDLVEAGQLTATEARHHPQRHIVTRALGIEPGVEIDTWLLELEPGDRYVLCSDGLVGEVPDDTIARMLDEVADPQQVADLLVGTANAMGGHDNITVVVIDVVAATVEEVIAEPEPVEAAIAPPVLGQESFPFIEGAEPPTTITEATGTPIGSAAFGGWLDDASPDPDATIVARPPTRSIPSTAAVPKRKRKWGPIVAFATALVLIAIIAFGAIAWYGRSTFYLGFRNDQVTLFRGRPGGVLWFHPTIEKTYQVARGSLTENVRAALDAGKDVPNRSAADELVVNLLQVATAATTTTLPPTTSTSSTTTLPPTTTAPATTTATTAPTSSTS